MAAMAEKDSRYLTARVNAASHINGSTPQTAPEIVEGIPHIDHRHGDGRAEIIGIAILDQSACPIAVLEPLSSIIVRISVRANDDLQLPIVGFMLRNHMGLDFAGFNTAREDFEVPPMRAGDIYTVDFHVQLPELYPSAFSFSPAIADGTLHTYVMCDWIDNAATLQMMSSSGQVYGYMRLPCRIELNRRLGQPSRSRVLSNAESRVG
jgi:hypothetical protein